MNRTMGQYLVGLNLIRHINPRRMAILLDRFPSPQAIWEATQDEIAALPGFAAVAAQMVSERSDEALERELENAEEKGIQFITLLDPDYPPLLRQIETPPPVLYVKGDLSVDTTRTIGIVGTRRSSGYGRAVASRLAYGLGRLGLIVVSGMAEGIDTAAHKGALKASAHTVAVLGAGFGHLYPASNRGLASRIERTGTLLTEYPLDMRPARWTFPQRNRILSGISRGVVVVEAPERSGALITARFALEQGREVFAVPGNLTSTASTGPNRLIKDGAKLVEDTGDIIGEFPDLSALVHPQAEQAQASVPSLSEQELGVYERIGLEPVHIDDIISHGELSPTEAAHILLRLQMADLIREVEGRRYIRNP
jgi:DNA processing protein